MRRTRRGIRTRGETSAFAVAALTSHLPARLLPCGAVAQAPPPAASQGNPNFGLKAGLYGQTTLEAGIHFQYAVRPGAAVNDSVDVVNLTDEAHTYHVYGADLIQGADGSLAPNFPADRQGDAGAWIHLSTGSVSLGPKGIQKVAFTVNVPEDASPGDHLGAVVASFMPPAKPGVIVVESRVALMVRVRIPGVARLDGVVGRLRVGRGRGARRFSVEVRNTGNLLLTTLGKIEVKHGHDTVAVVPVKPTQIYIIPGGKARFTARWTGTPWFGRRKSTAVFTLSAFREHDIERRSNTLTLSFFSWLVIILLLLLILGTVAYIYWRRRRQVESQSPIEPSPATIAAHTPIDVEGGFDEVDADADSSEWYS